MINFIMPNIWKVGNFQNVQVTPQYFIENQGFMR